MAGFTNHCSGQGQTSLDMSRPGRQINLTAFRTNFGALIIATRTKR